MANIDLSKYGISGTTEIVYNPSYEQLFEEETKSDLQGFEKGQESELGAVNVMTGVNLSSFVKPVKNSALFFVSFFFLCILAASFVCRP